MYIIFGLNEYDSSSGFFDIIGTCPTLEDSILWVEQNINEDPQAHEYQLWLVEGTTVNLVATRHNKPSQKLWEINNENDTDYIKGALSISGDSFKASDEDTKLYIETIRELDELRKQRKNSDYRYYIQERELEEKIGKLIKTINPSCLIDIFENERKTFVDMKNVRPADKE